MLLPFQSFGGQSDPGESTQNRFKDNFRFEPDEGRADAEVDADTKAKVPSLRAGEIKTIRL